MLSLFVFGNAAKAEDKAVMQLKWEHEFQFAGFYAALWQGFYAEEGLDVELRSAVNEQGEILEPLEELARGNVDFAVSGTELLIARDQGQMLSILAPLFQQSPMRLVALPETPMNSVLDLPPLRMAVASERARAEVQALFLAQGLDPGTIRFVDQPPTLDTLLQGQAEVVVTFEISALVEAEQRGLAVQLLNPADFSPASYGDTLVTHSELVQRRPEFVKRFVRASLKGWQYALQHRGEIADRISAELPRYLFVYDDPKAYNRRFANIINNYLQYPHHQIGQNDPLRWSRLAEQYRSLGLIQGQWSTDSMLYHPEGPQPRWMDWGLWALLGLFVIALLGRPYRAWPYLVLLLVTLVALLLVENVLRQSHQQEQRLNTARHLTTLSARLQGALHGNLSLISGMAAHVTANPALGQEAFNRFAQAIFDQDPLLTNIAAAPDMVIRYVYPLAGNEAALGLDYRSLATQWETARRSRENRGIVIAGPVELVQGGTAFIGRLAVFHDAEFWGVVSAPINTEVLYRHAGLLDPQLPIDLAIRGKDGKGDSGEVFYGAPSLFSDPLAIRSTVELGDGSWVLAARAKSHVAPLAPSLWLSRLSILSLAGMLALLYWSQSRQRQNDARYRAQLMQNDRLLREVGNLARIGGWKLEPDGQLSHWSPQCSDILALAQQRPSLKAFLSCLVPERGRLLERALHKARQGQPFDMELQLEAHPERWIRVIGKPFQQRDNTWQVIGAIQDISERKRYEQTIQHQANYDLLTQLPNRLLFNNRLEHALLVSKRHDTKLAVLFIDLDQFKPVNDRFGHKAGDAVLKEVGARLRCSVRASDTVARYSGDEFTVILPDLKQPEHARIVVDKILAQLNQPFHFDGHAVHCGASIGIAIFPEHGTDADALVNCADKAMYLAKSNGRNRGCNYSELQSGHVTLARL